jgi:hypothetical protein
MKELEEQCVCVCEILLQTWNNFTETFQLLNPLNAELNPVCHLLALLKVHHILHVSRIRVNQAYREDCMKGSPGPRKARMSQSQVKVMLIVLFDWKGIVCHEFVQCGQIVNKQLYQQVLTHLRDAVRRKRPKLWKNQTWMLYHDNSSAQTLLLIRSYTAKHQTSICASSTLLSGLRPSRLFPASQT